MEKGWTILFFRLCVALQAILLIGTSAASFCLIQCDDLRPDCHKLRNETLLMLAAAGLHCVGAIITVCLADKCLDSQKPPWKPATIQVILGLLPLSLLMFMVVKKDAVQMFSGQWTFILYSVAVALYGILMIITIALLCLNQQHRRHAKDTVLTPKGDNDVDTVLIPKGDNNVDTVLVPKGDNDVLL